jgi:hypothetical protein
MRVTISVHDFDLSLILIAAEFFYVISLRS